MQHIQISIEVREEEQDLLIGILSNSNATGFEQTATHLLAYFDENDFPSYDVNEALKDFTIHNQLITEQNWNELWESNFEPVVVNDFCGIRAHFHQPLKNVQYEIIITPKMSFGTGHHATTYLMIEQMQGLNFNNKTVFDFGTGTGILAILAEKLGAASIAAIDVDDWSIKNADENSMQNDCRNIGYRLSSAVPQNQSFDIILANINKNVLLQYAAGLKTATNPDGYLLLSGLLDTDETDIVQAYLNRGFAFLKQTKKSNWISLLFVNRK